MNNQVINLEHEIETFRTRENIMFLLNFWEKIALDEYDLEHNLMVIGKIFYFKKQLIIVNHCQD